MQDWFSMTFAAVLAALVVAYLLRECFEGLAGLIGWGIRSAAESARRRKAARATAD